MNSTTLTSKMVILKAATLVLLSLTAMICLAGSARADDQMPMPTPDASLANTSNPHLVLEIKFAADGHVKSCHAIKKSSSPALDKLTIDFVKKNWDCPSMAGHTAHQPVDYQPGVVTSVPATNAPAEQQPAPAFGTAFNGSMGKGSSSSSSGSGKSTSH